MSSYPSFVRDRLRPGLEDYQAAPLIWGEMRGSLDKVIADTFAEAGATQDNSGEEAKVKGALGEAIVIEASRAEPPMTSEEALELGGKVVASWRALKEQYETDKSQYFPSFCDDVFPLPPEYQTQ